MTPSHSDIDRAVTILSGGGIVVLPTDTIYGLHARADDLKAVERIFTIKGRDDTKPLIVLGSSIEQLEQAGAFFSASVRAVLKELWPGPLTAIVPLTGDVAAARGSRTVGARIPDLEWLRELVSRTGPIASTSVNRSGEPAIQSPNEMSHELLASIDSVIDVGPLTGKASAVVDFSGDEPRFIREGEHLFTQKVWKTLRKSL